MTSDTAKWAAPKGRVSRQDAEKALIDAVIKLVDTTPIADITIHELAHEAGVNFGYINRYFESRLNLFAAASDELADRGLDQMRNITSTAKTIDGPKSKDLSQSDLETSRQVLIPIGVKRLMIVQFLVSSGVPAERFVKKSQEVLTASVEATSQAGLEPEIARARIIHGIAMMWSAATLGPILGLTSQELYDSYALFFATVTATEKPSK